MSLNLLSWHEGIFDHPCYIYAPSERVWLREAGVIRAKRTCLNPKVMAQMMFVQKNSELIHDHWKVLQPDVPVHECYLPSPVNDVDEYGAQLMFNRMTMIMNKNLDNM
jgi:hypothetical protein